MKTAKELSLDFQTPPEVAKYMITMVPAGAKIILEPTPGDGNIVKELNALGFEVKAPKDFFLLPKEDRYDCIVMNPPFSFKYTILDHAPTNIHKAGMRMGYYFLMECLQRSDHVIALMPFFTISDSDMRLRSLKKWGFKSLTALPRRTFQYARIQTCVFEMEKGYHGPTEFKVYDLLKNIQIKML
jgi:type I restriction-modification system DNA methylase subunit